MRLAPPALVLVALLGCPVDAVAEALAAHVPALALANGDFEAPPVGFGWYIVPDGGPDAAFGWASGAAPGAYLLANSVAAHFTAPTDGNQALLLSSAGWVRQDVPLPAAGPVTLRYQVLTGAYPGDGAGRLEVSLSLDGAPLASSTENTPTTPGMWEAHTLTAEAPHAGTLTVEFTATEGMSWLDAVHLVPTTP
jgi:hypothetical protein